MGTTTTSQTTADTDTTVRMAAPVVTSSAVKCVLQEKQRVRNEEKTKVRNKKKILAENETTRTSFGMAEPQRMCPICNEI
jgi:hypothetical protein